MNIKDKVKMLVEYAPKSTKSNTEFYLLAISIAYENRTGNKLPEVLQDIIRSYPPESVIRYK